MLPYRDAPESVADDALTVIEAAPRPEEGSFKEGSVYRKTFKQGATLVPRMLCIVERVRRGRIGSNPKMPVVRSRRSTQEKKPWKTLPEIEHAVEAEYMRPVLLGKSILPFRVLRAFDAVIPVDKRGESLGEDRPACPRAAWGTACSVARMKRLHRASDGFQISRRRPSFKEHRGPF